MVSVGTILLTYLFLLSIGLYIMIFGNNKCHRNGIVGSLYRFFSLYLPEFLNKFFRKIFKLKNKPTEEDSCMGKGGPCRYFILIFFIIFFSFIILIYFLFIYPYLNILYENPIKHQFLSIFLVPIPWIIVILLQFIDPGEINSTNVNSYLEKYPHDEVIYKKKMCPTLKIPVVPRSRYCNYTHKRIAYVFIIFKKKKKNY